MASYTINATITNSNDIQVNYTLSCVIYNSSGTAIKTLDTTTGSINASSSQSQSVLISLTDTEDTNFSYATISVYFSASGYSDSDIVSQNVSKPSSSGYSGTYRIISGLGLETPTDVLFSNSTDFDNLTFEDWTDSLGNVFVKFPTFYRKNLVIVDGQVVSFVISNKKEDGTFLPYPCFVRADGTIRDYIYVGKYNNRLSSGFNSISSTNNEVTMTIGDARRYAQALGSGYYLMHVDVKLFLCDLALAITKTVDINNGGDVSADKFFGIEGLLLTWMDGLATNSGYYLYCHDPSKCVDSPTTSTDGYVALSYTHPILYSQNNISKLGYDSNYPFMNLPSAQVSVANFDTYYCDAFLFSSSTSNPSSRIVGTSFAQSGWWELSISDSWSDKIRARLCYLP